MAFSQVTITHEFDLPPGALGTVEFTPADPGGMHNGATTVAGTRRAVLGSSGLLSQTVEATTDADTSPPGVPYRIVVRITGEPARTYYARVPHDQGSSLDLGDVLAWSGVGSGPGSGGSGFAYDVVELDLVDGVLTPDAADGYGPHRYTATSNIALNPPSGGGNGQPLEVQIKASGADRVLTVGGDAVTIPAGGRWWGTFSYDADDDEWLLRDVVIGGSSSGGGSGGTTALLDSGVLGTSILG